MEWRLEWGPHLKSLQAQAKKTGVPPAPLSRIPKLKPGDKYYLDAFEYLDRCRTGGLNGPNPLSMSDIVAFLAAVEVDSVTERLKYIELIQILDSATLAHWARKNKKKK